MLGIVQDITDRKRAELELQHHRDQLEQMVEVRTQKLREALQKLEEVADERRPEGTVLEVVPAVGES